MQATYDYPASGNYAETIATLADGRRVVVNTQYGDVLPTKGVGMAGIDCAALLADARINGKFGRAPVASESDVDRANREAGLDKYESNKAAIDNAMAE